MHNYNQQYGRSMIEMLGVLAIIGVLSVGGIMGYSQAMFRHKINKTIEQITYIAASVRTAFAPQKNYADVNNTTLQKKARIFPEDMWKANRSYPQHLWEGNVYLSAAKKNSTDANSNKAFNIAYRNMPQDACIELITHSWGDASVTAVIINNPQNTILGEGNYHIVAPVNIDDAVKLCDVPASDTTGIDYLYFSFEVDPAYYQGAFAATAAKLSGS